MTRYRITHTSTRYGARIIEEGLSKTAALEFITRQAGLAQRCADEKIERRDEYSVALTHYDSTLRERVWEDYTASQIIDAPEMEA